MEIEKEGKLIKDFIGSTDLGKDLFYSVIVEMGCKSFLDWMRKEGFEIISYVMDHDDYIEQSRKHFALEGCNLGGRKPKTVPPKVQKATNRSGNKSKRKGVKNV